MSDFNLSAAISVQLAKSSGAKLAKDITKVLNGTIKDMKPKITPVLGTMSAQLQRIFPPNKNTGVTVKVNLEIGKAKGTAELTELLKDKTIKIDVEFSDKAKKAIDDFSTSLSKLRESSKGFEELQKLVKYMNTVGKVDLDNLTPAKDKAKSKAKRDKRIFEDLSKQIDEIAKKARSADKGGFFESAQVELKKLITDLGKGSEIIDRFGGLNGKPAKNLIFALKSVYKAMTDIEIKQKKLDKSGLLSVTPGLNDSLEQAKKDLSAILGTLNAAEDIPLAASIKAATKPMDDLITSANQYRKLLRDIQAEAQTALASGASADRVALINERKLLAESSRDKGVGIDTLKGSDEFIDLVSRANNFTQVERAALKAANSVEKYRNEVSISDNFNSQGARESGSAAKVDKLLADFEALYTAEAKANKPDSFQKINQGLDKLRVDISATKDEAIAFEAVLKNFDDKKAFYDAKGMKESLKVLEKAREDVINLQRAFGGVSTSSNIFQQLNQGIEKTYENEKKLEKFILTIDKLRASLQFSIGGGVDFAGVLPDTDKLESKISGMLAGFDEREIKKTLTGESYNIRAKDKLNKLLNSSFDAFDQAIVDTAGAGAGINKIGPQAFKDARAELDRFISGLNLTSNAYQDIGKNIDLVKSKADKLFALATIKAEGGFIGAISKSLGLAAKRLTTFLFAARAIYGVQNAIIDSTTAAVELDTEFTRLEQIFAGSRDSIGSVEKNVASLSNEILTLAKNYGVAATEIAKSADIFAQAGIQGRSLEKILEISTKARLGPTFGSNIEISEAIIASMNQFKIKADEMEDVIGGISQVSAQFAVESDGITKAIRRAGGSFAAAKADGQSYVSALADFVGAFTVLKEQTREADETLATSLRNVLNRLQRSNVRKYLQDNFNINLLDANNQFIGFSEAIARVAARIKELGIKSGDPRFAELVQKLAGSLQSSRLTSLLAGAGDISKAVAEFQRGGESLDRDTDIAFGSLENKLSRAKNAVVELFTEIARSSAVKTLVELFTILTQAVTGALRAISGLNVAILATGAALLGIKSFGTFSNIVVKGVAGLSQSGLLGPGKGFNTGGLVPGIGPNVDTEPYMLTKGEYVINRHAVNKYGKGFFNDLNSGKIKHAATGSGPKGMISSFREKGGNAIAGFVNSIFDKLDKLLGGGQNDLIPDGTIADLEKIMKEFGFGVKDLGKYVKEFGYGSPIRGAGGAYSPDRQRVDITEDTLQSKYAKFIVQHEVGHALYNKDVAKSIPSSVKAFTADRMAQSPIYKGASSQIVKEEQFADSIFKLISRRQMDPEVQSWMPDAAEFDAFESALKAAGIELQYFQTEAKKAVAAQKQISELDISSMFNDANNIQQKQQTQGVRTPNKKSDTIIANIKRQEWLAKVRRSAESEGLEFDSLKYPRSKVEKEKLKNAYESHQSHIGRGRELGVLNDESYKTLSRRKFTNKKAFGYDDTSGFFEDPLGVDPKYLPKARYKNATQQTPAAQIPIQPPLNIVDKIREQQLLIGNSGNPDKVYSRSSEQNKQLKKSYISTKNSLYQDFIDDKISYPEYKTKSNNLRLVNKQTSNIAGGGVPRNPSPPGSGSGGGNPPPNNPIPPSAGNSITNLFSKFNLLAALLPAVIGGLGYYASSSKDASENVKKLADAAIAAVTAITAYTVITNAATFATSKNAAGGIIPNIADTTKGFGGGGFFDKYGKGGTPISGGPTGRFGRVVNGVKGLTGSINSGIGKVAGQAGAKLATYVPSFAKLGQAAFSAAKFLGPQVLGAAVVGLVAALGSFNDAAIRASEEVIAKSTSEREVVEERAKIDKRQSTSRGLGVLGKVAGGAALGATVSGPVGAAIGGIGGFFLGIFTQFKNSKIGTIISNGLKWAGEWVSAFFEVIGNGIGWITGKIDDVFNATANLFGVGVSEADINKKKEFQANIDKGGANINSFNRGFKRKGGATDEEFNNLFKAVQQTSAVTSGYSSLSDEDKTKAKGQAERLKSALDGVNAFQRGTIIEKAKKSGIDIANMFDKVGLEFDQIGPAAAIASDKLSKMFASMQSVSDRVGSAISNFNTGNDIISSRAAGIAGEGVSGGVSAGVFENLRRGGTPTGLAAEETNKLFRDLERFSPAAALNARVEAGGARAAFDVQNQLAGKEIKVDAGNTGDQIGNLIGDMFDKSLQGQPKEVRDKLGAMLDTYLESQQEALNGVVGADNTVNNEKIGEVISGFTESIKRGGLDTAEAFNSANAQFKQAMDGIIKRRIEYENKITALGRQNVDRQKSFIEFQNKAAGKPDTDITLAQAKGLDSQRQAILLRGTGVGGNASVADIRKRYDELTAADPTGKDPQIQAFKDNLYQALEGIASGTDSFTTAIKEFDKASEKAKRRTEELSNALLGTDENLFNTLKGINLEQQVLGAGDKGQAFLALQNADDASRQALTQRLASDPERKKAFEDKLGLGSNISASREAQNVAAEFGNQAAAGDAMIGINQKLSADMTGLAGELMKNREAFNTFGLQINNFANAANNLANNLGNIPQNIAHAHTFKVDPIQISFTGAEALASLDGPMKGVITEIVNNKIGEFANNLKSKNKGLTVDTLTGNTVTA